MQERLTRSGLLQKAVVADRFLPERFIAYLGPYDNTTAVRAFVKQFRQQGIRTVKPILEGELSYGVEIASFSSREAAEKYLVSGRAPDMKELRLPTASESRADRLILFLMRSLLRRRTASEI